MKKCLEGLDKINYDDTTFMMCAHFYSIFIMCAKWAAYYIDTGKRGKFAAPFFRITHIGVFMAAFLFIQYKI